jgi:hypothetical protein
MVDIKANTQGYLIDSNIFTGGGATVTFEPGARTSNTVDPGDIH